MEKSIPQRTFYFYLILCSLTILTVTSCVYTNTKKEESVMSLIPKNNKSEFDNIEAVLLAKVKEQNFNIILISKVAIEKENSFEIKSLAVNLIEEQEIINKNINGLVSEKLIIIPNTNIENYYTNKIEFNNGTFEIEYIKLMKKIMNNQVSVLKQLSKKTDDSDFKILSLQTIVKLKERLGNIDNPILKNN